METPPPYHKPERRGLSTTAWVLICVGALIVGAVGGFIVGCAANMFVMSKIAEAGARDAIEDYDESELINNHDGNPFILDKTYSNGELPPWGLVNFGDTDPIVVGVPEGSIGVEHISQQCKAMRRTNGEITVYIDNYRWETSADELRSLNKRAPSNEYCVTISRANGKDPLKLAITGLASEWDVDHEQIGSIHVTGEIFIIENKQN
ncbi:MAG: hypothetical protein NC336_04900 [Clostridium sp.]|nr:hypothetical protein [Clostridium sp.]